jgi:hypothetical protein
MPSPRDYRQHAIELLKLAETVESVDERACLVSLARHWNKIADQLSAPAPFMPGKPEKARTSTDR